MLPPAPPDPTAILDTIYQAAIEPQRWPDLLASLADHLGGSSAWLSELDPRTGAGNGIIARIDPSMPALYQNRYAALNPFPALRRRQDDVADRRPSVVVASDLIDYASLVKGTYYNEFMRPQDVHDVLIVRLALAGPVAVAININRPQRWGPFEPVHLRRARHLHTHLARAFTLGKRVGAAVTLPDKRAAAVVDATASIRHLNARCEQLLLAQPGLLRARNRVLAAADPSHAPLLQQAIAEATAPDPAVRKSSVLAFGGAILAINPARTAELPVFTPGPLALVLVDDMRADPDHAQSVFRHALRLTPAEARVAWHFLDGAAPREIAGRLGISPNTVRVQFGHIFAKTGVSRQADLARLLDRIVTAELDKLR